MDLLVRVLVNLVDTVTYPVYYAIYRPAERQALHDRPRALQDNPSDPYSPWQRSGAPPPVFSDNIDTVHELFAKMYTTYRDQPCIGHRKVLELQDHGQKKLLSDEFTYLTYNEFNEKTRALAAGLRTLSVNPSDKVSCNYLS